jgi:hypothetical protein
MRSKTVMVFLKSCGQDDQIQERLLLNFADSKLEKMPGPEPPPDACFTGTGDAAPLGVLGALTCGMAVFLVFFGRIRVLGSY